MPGCVYVMLCYVCYVMLCYVTVGIIIGSPKVLAVYPALHARSTYVPGEKRKEKKEKRHPQERESNSQL